MDHEVENKHVQGNPAWLHVFAGGSIGALLGLCMGLSVSPVVATVLAGLATSLLALLGLKDSPAQAHPNTLRVFGFGLFAILALATGLLIRTHSWLSPSLAAQRTELKEAGFPDADIRMILLARELGGSSNANKEEKSKGAEDKSEAHPSGSTLSSAIPSVLFASSPEECQKLDPQQFEDVNSFLASLKNRKGKYAKLAAALEKLDPAARKATAQAFYEFSCQ